MRRRRPDLGAWPAPARAPAKRTAGTHNDREDAVASRQHSPLHPTPTTRIASASGRGRSAAWSRQAGVCPFRIPALFVSPLARILSSAGIAASPGTLAQDISSRGRGQRDRQGGQGLAVKPLCLGCGRGADGTAAAAAASAAPDGHAGLLLRAGARGPAQLAWRKGSLVCRAAQEQAASRCRHPRQLWGILLRASTPCPQSQSSACLKGCCLSGPCVLLLVGAMYTAAMQTAE